MSHRICCHFLLLQIGKDRPRYDPDDFELVPQKMYTNLWGCQTWLFVTWFGFKPDSALWWHGEAHFLLNQATLRGLVLWVCLIMSFCHTHVCFVNSIILLRKWSFCRHVFPRQHWWEFFLTNLSISCLLVQVTSSDHKSVGNSHSYTTSTVTLVVRKVCESTVLLELSLAVELDVSDINCEFSVAVIVFSERSTSHLSYTHLHRN